MRAEQLETLVTQVGPVLDPLGIAALPDTGTWGIAIDEDTSVLVDLAEDGTKLVLSCEVGTPPAGDHTALYELLLRHNYHWDRTGGVRLALDGPDGGVVQILDLAADGLDVPTLAATVDAFAKTVQAWRDIVRGPTPSADLPTGDPDFLFIRA